MTRHPLHEPDERLRRILRFVVESHVSLAEPVGSQYVRAAYHLSISPATIRNAMQQLEELGLLAHPHTSAGRVPTEAGYRYYVDRLMRPEALPAPMRRALDGALDDARRDGAIEERLPSVLARAARQLALLSLRRRDASPIRRFELVALDGGELLAAVGTESGPLATTTWIPAAAVDAATLRRAESWLRATLPLDGAAGLEALAARARVEAPADLRPVLGEVLARAARLVAGLAHPAVLLDGAEHIAAQPEFQSADTLGPLVEVLADRAPLARALESFARAGAPLVAIGHENAPAALQGCSIVGMSVPFAGTSMVIGVLGPVRMHYRRAVSLMAHVRERWGSGTAT
jgi:heat-inducible transcriptional repressor